MSEIKFMYSLVLLPVCEVCTCTCANLLPIHVSLWFILYSDKLQDFPLLFSLSEDIHLNTSEIMPCLIHVHVK